MQKLLIALQILLVAAIFSTAETDAQDKDPIDHARAFPPTLLGNNETETALAQIDWQLKHLKQTREYYGDVLDSTQKVLEHNLCSSIELFENLPMELRYTNEQVRAELIGVCLRELLSARLEVASHEEIISQLSQELEKPKLERARIDRLQKEKHQLQIQALEKKLGLTANEYEQNKKRYEKGSKTKQEMERSRYSMQISEYELAQAKLEMEIESESRANEIAQRVVAARIEAQPIKARAAAAEKFLKLVSDSSETLKTIESNNRNFESGKKHIEDYLLKMSANSDEITELESLKEMIQSALKKADANTDLKEKTKSDDE